jgi:hypothetical protein
MSMASGQTADVQSMTAQRETRMRAAMDKLLHNLRDWVQVYTRREDDKMLEHDVVWVTGISGEGGPGQVVLDAIKQAPELWTHAIPEECCIVPRRMLEERLGTDASTPWQWSARGSSIPPRLAPCTRQSNNVELEDRPQRVYRPLSI